MQTKLRRRRYGRVLVVVARRERRGPLAYSDGRRAPFKLAVDVAQVGERDRLPDDRRVGGKAPLPEVVAEDDDGMRVGCPVLLREETAAEQLDEESRLFLHNIRHGAAQMQALIADLLAYARMERRALGNDVLDLRACIDEILRGYADEIAAQGFDMRVEVPAFTVRADRDGLAIVLRNVLENAFKFRHGDRTLVVEVGARRQDGSQDGNVVLWVRDNGIGFDMKFQERIFEIFSRLERAEDYPGTGVGLALVRKAMHRMGGRVWVDSMPGRGTTFFLELRHD